MFYNQTLPETDALLAQLLAHPLPEIDFSLERIEVLLARLGNPHLALPPVVHVAGTNGKGSLIAYLRAILSAAGYRVHVYTSPHLVRFHERIVLAGEEISDLRLREVLARVVRESADFPLTFFESTTVAALLAFAETPADIVLLETGMGGRLDATNVIPAPELTAITPISLDHTDFLGETLAEIAREKAGIMKPGVPCVLGKQEPEARAVLERRAAELGVPLTLFGRDYDVEEGLAPSLPGAFQYENAAAARACIRHLCRRFEIGEEAVRYGITHAIWPARLQLLKERDGWTVWLDGGHNPAAGEVVAAWIRARGSMPHLVLGMLKGKDAAGYLAPLVGQVASLTVVPILQEPKSADPADLLAIAQALGLRGRAAGSVEEALAQLATDHPAGGEVLIAGSLYLAGHVLARNQDKKSP